MHFEILVEDQSGKKALDILVPKIVGNKHTFHIHAYKGIGRIPANLRGATDASKRILLDQLPRLLRGYGNAFTKYHNNYSAAVIVVCDLDNKCLKEFRAELLNLETSVERAGVCGFPGAGQGATTRNGRSIARSCNAAMRPENRAIQPVALSPNG